MEVLSFLYMAIWEQQSRWELFGQRIPEIPSNCWYMSLVLQKCNFVDSHCCRPTCYLWGLYTWRKECILLMSTNNPKSEIRIFYMLERTKWASIHLICQSWGRLRNKGLVELHRKESMLLMSGTKMSKFLFNTRLFCYLQNHLK